MKILVDTSVWSLALRRDEPPDLPEVQILTNALRGEGDVYTTGLVVQELLQGFSGATDNEKITSNLSSLAILVPDMSDHVEAAKVRNLCRRKGVQIGTIDALIARLAIRYELALLTTDKDFSNMAKHVEIQFAK